MSGPANPLAIKGMEDVPIAQPTGIAAIALSMALQYHNINTVQDGTLYQQYKMEGRNMETLHLDMVFETALAMERHLLGAEGRFAAVVFDAADELLTDIAAAVENERSAQASPSSDGESA